MTRFYDSDAAGKDIIANFVWEFGTADGGGSALTNADEMGCVWENGDLLAVEKRW
ncbi:hypothetical protein QT970_07005 [Microcoleus sp. herbarium8]|uniref:hypothetical protein n=1 Tax=Microcoleus sp. herbarium8 TaxID=3055436 RepID=UPI002FD1BD6F